MSISAESIFDLSPAEKLQLVEDLWDDLSSDPQNVPLLERQEQELRVRRERLVANPGSALSWEMVRDRVRQRHAD